MVISHYKLKDKFSLEVIIDYGFTFLSVSIYILKFFYNF